ncbi:hypothetical protein DFA_08036 [Cavenderia fasciculata]|uniref:Transmembrane protein n=1 Tax=Cavenderia fasciculata TaxID=261658 RepID=F4Q4P6_CACFS|nr:uncharacterized protein DFA_08036 [Cavenderia fasciculata]EGG17055.1 hypothetical protein DFA_08036 [Cavenderia fasciculata]|eukprot:XP_004355539.1 hypothetical protein DFA_08036 [Cavenderia fasciculata]
MLSKILFVGSIALPFLVNLPIYGIVPNNRDTRIESFYSHGIEKIRNVCQQIETKNTIIMENQDIRDMATFAEMSNKLCRILAQRDVVLMLLNIIMRAEEIWENSYSHRLPLSNQSVYRLYTIFDTESLMSDCTDLLNSILPFVKDTPYDLLYKAINFHPESPTSYRLACAILKTMTLKQHTIQPFINVGMIRMVRFYLDNQMKSEYSQLEDYWLQISRIIYKDRQYQFKSSLSKDQDNMAFIEEYYKKGRFKLWLPKEIRLPPHNMLFKIVTDAFGYYFGWLNMTGFIVGHFYSNTIFSDGIYRRLESTFSRYLACSIFVSSMLLYFSFLLSSTNGKIYILASTITLMAIYSFRERQVKFQRLSGPLYKSFQQRYQTPHQKDQIK